MQPKENNEDYYGAPSQAATAQTLRARLRDYYEPGDFVVIQNIDTEPIKYQFARPDDIETYSAYPGHKDTIQKRVPTVVTLQPGQTKLCAAYEADLMIENLVKQMTTRKVNLEIGDGKQVKWQTANWNDPITYDALIKQIFIGKENVVKTYEAEPKHDTSPEPIKSK